LWEGNIKAMLSVAIITHNEEENIKDALESVKWADEIVVVDSFSTDRTQKICRQYTDKIYSLEWSGFAGQKQKAVSLTTNPWVLVLDADERVGDALKDEILSIVKKGRVDGYYIPRKNYFSGRWIRHGGWWPDYTLRLFRKEKGSFEKREVHEVIKIKGRTGYLHNPLEHYTYKGVGDYLKRMDNYSTLGALELFKNGQRANIIDITMRPLFTFLKMFLLRLGILDGFHGILLAGLYSFYTFTKYSKLWEIQRR